ncbi:MAG: hypothetical protein ACT4PZ_05895 [Panacagrimonas sp.]
MSNESWLSTLSGDRLLIQTTIPGSHDAGVYGVGLSTVFSPKKFARCQGSNIYNQAIAGSRMFDCRVFLKRDKDSGEFVPTMGHFSGMTEKYKHKITSRGSKGALGAYGGTFITAVKDAIAFVMTYPTEFLILRFSHTYCPNEVSTALAMLIADKPLLGNYIYRKSTNIALCPLGELRGKVIMVFASEFHANFSVDDGYLPFYKYSDGVETVSGLCTCGTYKAKAKMTKVHDNAENGALEHKNHPKDHLHFVYWQQTMTLGLGNIETATTRAKKVEKGQPKALSGGAHANLADFVKEIELNMSPPGGRIWARPNVISHDFVKEETCSEIIKLNRLRA